MHNFAFLRAQRVEDAIQAGAHASTAQQGAEVRFMAGGTTLVDLMKLDVEQPRQVIDITHLPLNQVETLPDGRMKIGALVRNADLAVHPDIARHYRVLTEALLSGASAQLRNMATTGGNLLQRTRCVYFRDATSACNKRQPGSGCPAIDGYNRHLAILGGSAHCIAAHPSDMNVALTALEASITIQGTNGERTIPIDDFFVLPGDTPYRETVMGPGDLVIHVWLPKPQASTRSHYLKLRDRASYEFALASAAVSITMEGEKITQARIAMGGIGTRPWRSRDAEFALAGQTPSAAAFERAADILLADAKPQSQNGFKQALAKRCLMHALGHVTT